jgi:plastocyanin
MGKRLLTVIAMLMAVGLMGFAAGCGDDDEESADTAATTSATTAESGGGGGATSVGMTEYEFDPSDATAAAGDTLELTNDGQIPHNYTIVDDVSDPEAGEELVGSDDFAPGDSGTMTVDVDPGEYGVLCTIPGHAEQGMVGSIKVE